MFICPSRLSTKKPTALTYLILYLIRSPQSFEWPAPRNSRLCRIISLQCVRCLANSFALSSWMSASPEKVAVSSRTHFCQFLLGRPLDLLPWAGFQSSRYLGVLCSGIRETCPNQRNLFAPTKVSIGLIRARSKTSTFLVRWYHFILSILLRQRWWKTSRRCCCLFVVFQTSLP